MLVLGAESLIVNYWDHPDIISKVTVHYADVTVFPGRKGDFMDLVTATMNEAMGLVTDIQDVDLASQQVTAHFLEIGILELDEHQMRRASPRYVGNPVSNKKFDVVVSSNIFSQLLVQLKNTIQKDRKMRDNVGGMAIFFGEELLLAQHIAFLQQHSLRSDDDDGRENGQVLFFLDAPKAIVDQHVGLMLSRFSQYNVPTPDAGDIQPWVMLREMNEKWAWNIKF